jgi:hypothetical protein
MWDHICTGYPTRYKCEYFYRGVLRLCRNVISVTCLSVHRSPSLFIFFPFLFFSSHVISSHLIINSSQNHKNNNTNIRFTSHLITIHKIDISSQFTVQIRFTKSQEQQHKHKIHMSENKRKKRSISTSHRWLPRSPPQLALALAPLQAAARCCIN